MPVNRHYLDCQIGGNNQNRYPLTEIPANASDELSIGQNGQVYAPNSSDPVLKGQLDDYCAQQYTAVEIPAAPTVTDPCGTGNAVWVKPANVTPITWSLNAKNELIATLDAGYVFTNGQTSYNYGQAIETNTDPCVVQVQLPSPQVDDPCGLRNARWITPTNTDQFIWSVENGELIVRTTVGYEFADGSTYHNFGAAVDSNTLCRVAIPETPTPTDPCGIRNASWSLPDNTDQYTWSIDEDGNLIATTTTNYLFTDGSKTHNFGTAVDSGELCPDTIITAPAAPTAIDACNPANIASNIIWNFASYKNTELYTWSLLDNGSLIVSAAEGYAFTGGLRSITFALPTDTGTRCPIVVHPTMPTINDSCGTKNDSIDLPKDTEQIHYRLGVTINGTTPVIAMAQPGYIFNVEGLTTYTYLIKLTDKACSTATAVTTKNVSSTPVSQPIELPLTGPTERAPILAVLAGVVTYLIIYVAQNRRRITDIGRA